MKNQESALSDENIKIILEQEDKILQKINTSINQSREDGINAPDFLEQLKHEQPLKKSAIGSVDTEL